MNFPSVGKKNIFVPPRILENHGELTFMYVLLNNQAWDSPRDQRTGHNLGLATEMSIMCLLV